MVAIFSGILLCCVVFVVAENAISLQTIQPRTLDFFAEKDLLAGVKGAAKRFRGFCCFSTALVFRRGVMRDTPPPECFQLPRLQQFIEDTKLFIQLLLMVYVTKTMRLQVTLLANLHACVNCPSMQSPYWDIPTSWHVLTLKL